MATFDERKDAFENKFANEQNLKFKVEALRNKMFGAWAAEMEGLDEKKPTNTLKTSLNPISKKLETTMFLESLKQTSKVSLTIKILEQE